MRAIRGSILWSSIWLFIALRLDYKMKRGLEENGLKCEDFADSRKGPSLTLF
jgi:hypothetical protein